MVRGVLWAGWSGRFRWSAACCVLLLAFGSAGVRADTGCSGTGCAGIAFANKALEVQGAGYRLGEPSRSQGSVSTVPAYSDCSGLVWWAARNVFPTVDFPTVSQDQYNYGSHLAGTLWDGTEFPRGSLLFLHDENPALGGGATHVSIYIGNGEAMDCYNEQFGCHVHNVQSDNYYRDHWLGATYPWGDSPVSTTAGGRSGRGVGSGEIPALISQPGSTYTELSQPVMAWGSGFGGPVATAQVATADKDGPALVTQETSGLADLVGYAKAIDFFAPLHVELVIVFVLLVLLVRGALSAVRYLIGLSPF